MKNFQLSIILLIAHYPLLSPALWQPAVMGMVLILQYLKYEPFLTFNI